MIESETPGEAFIRQRWEQALGAARVALDAIREIWPSERSVLAPSEREHYEGACRAAEALVIALETMSVPMLGQDMVNVLAGRVTRLPND